MPTLLHESIHCYSGTQEYQKVPKWIIWVPHVVPLPYLLQLIRVHHPCQNADASSYLLVPGYKDSKMYCHQHTL